MGLSSILLSPVIYNFFLTDYQRGRIISWFSTNQSLSEKWNILQSEISIGSGGLFGDGFLNSKQNEFNFLPEADTDFIFSIFTQQEEGKTKTFLKEKSSITAKQKKSFDFPFTNFLSS